MSVAFRRESDEEHLEPRFELPIPAGPNFVTPRGLALLEAKVAELEAAVAAQCDVEAAKAIQRELRYYRTRLATAEPAAAPADGQVGIGSTVTFRLDGKERVVTITGHDEADPAAGMLAFSAPLARALIGAAEGDLVDFGGVEEAIAVVAVRP